jgi:outer membrane receptor protein involved in Fe transport
MRKPELWRVAACVAFAITASSAAWAAEEELEEVQVTGSRIAQAPGMFTPTPVTSVVIEDLKTLAPSNLIESLNTLPVFSANTTQQQALGGQNSGGSNVNLHGAGANRTLTLLDGRRVVSSNRFGTVDVNSLPDMLLKNIETVTGGASASYGTDAVAGVVNFILDTRFEGLNLKGQYGITDRSDGENNEVGLAFGHGFAGGRLHVIGSLQHAEYDAISDLDGVKSRPWFRQASRVTNPNTSGPTFLRRNYVVPTNFTTRGLIVDNAAPTLNRLLFDSTGTALAPMPFYGVGSRDGGCLCQALPQQEFTVNSDDEVSAGFKRSSAFARFGFDLTSNVELFAQGMWSENFLDTRRESVALVSANVWQGRIFTNNAYLTPALQTRLFNGAPVARTTTDNTTGTPESVRWVDFSVFLPDVPENPIGDTRQITANHMKSATLGFDATIGGGALKDWNVNGYVQKGWNRQDFNTVNGIRVDRIFLALDAVRDPSGNVVCRAALAQYDPNGYFRGCAPINLFGGMETVTPEAASWIRDDYKVASQWIDQVVGEVSMSGELGFGLPAGNISSAFGVSYRKDTLDQKTVHPDDEFPALPDGRLLASLGLMPAGLRGIVPQQGCTNPLNGATGVPGLRFVPTSYCGDGNSSSVQFSSLRTIAGSSNVKEAFTEFQIPLLKDLPFAHRLESNVTARWADYSGSGNVWAWKGGVSWELNEQIRLRATRSRDVRAANLRDRFDQTRGGFTVTDRAQTPPASVSGTSFSGGNPDVSPEKADTTTVGIVLQPEFLGGFQTSVDWYRINIEDAITQLTSQQLVDRCVAGDASLCQYVLRTGNQTNGPIYQINSLFINLNRQKIEGIDYEISYARGLDLLGGGPERLTTRLFATRLIHNINQAPGAAADEQVGQVAGVGLPKWKATGIVSYSNGPLTGTLVGRYIGGGILDRTLLESNVAVPGRTTIDDNHVGSVFYTDLTLGVKPARLEGLRVYGTVTNLFDRAPPQMPGSIGRTGVLDGFTSLHDTVGRRYTVGVEYKF